jgi:hypothetical protein
MRLSILFLVFVAQFSDCAAPLCRLTEPESPAARVVTIALLDTETIARVSDEHFIVAGSPPQAPLATDVTTLVSGRQELIESTPPLFPYDLAYFSTGDEGWWFTRQGSEGREPVVFFVESGDRVQKTRVTLPGQLPVAWLPIAGDEPRGLFLTVGAEQPSLQVHLVTPAGVEAMGAFFWWQTTAHLSVDRSRWSAEVLPDGRFLVVAVDGPEQPMALRLRVIGEEGRESRIPCLVPIERLLATAVDVTGRLAIVGRSAKGEVVAVLTDVDQPDSARCRVISEPGEVAAEPPFGTPSVVATGEDFVAAWIRDDGSVRACELEDLRSPPVVLKVGEGAHVELPLRQLVFADADHLTFFWKGRYGEISTRRMPARLTGLAFAKQIGRVLCSVFE